MPIKPKQTHVVNHILQTCQSITLQYIKGSVLSSPLSFLSQLSVRPPYPATLRGIPCSSLTGLHSVLKTECFLFLYISLSLNTVSLASNVLFLTGLLTYLFIHQHSFQMVPFQWRHPEDGYSFLRSDSSCVLLTQLSTHTLSSAGLEPDFS